MCLRPINLKTRDAIVPCSKCPECIKRRVSEWSFRLMQEDKVSRSSRFVTLTYDSAKVPISKNGFLTLDKRNIQLFIKRLRKSQSGNGVSGIKYYCVGEYGGRTKRPHYHCILFNVELELIQSAWNMGQIHYGEVSGASVGYTLKYMSKQKRRKPEANDDRLPEFALMSKDWVCRI